MAIITVNGTAQDLAENLSLAELLTLNNVLQPDMVSIQLNGEFILREDYESTVLKANDEVDFLYFMGGGNS
jgi:sulfur carrier protein